MAVEEDDEDIDEGAEIWWSVGASGECIWSEWMCAEGVDCGSQTQSGSPHRIHLATRTSESKELRVC